jgi:small subunit ribosomal protein S19
MEEITKKQFMYRGKTIEELKKLDVREFAKIAPSRNKRNILRNFQEIEKFIFNARKKIERKKTIKTHKRDLVIMPEMIGWRILIYNGNKFIPVDVVGEMLGHKFGEFSLTRGKIKHSKAGVGATKGSKHKSKK